MQRNLLTVQAELLHRLYIQLAELGELHSHTEGWQKAHQQIHSTIDRVALMKKLTTEPAPSQPASKRKSAWSSLH